MRKPVLLLDIDGVAADLISACLPIVEKLTGRKHVHDDVDQWKIHHALSLSAEEITAFYEHFEHEGFCFNVPVYAGAKEGIARLRELCDVHPVTAPFDAKFWTYERDRWLFKHFWIPREDVVHTYAKHLVTGDIFVEDKTSTLIKWREHHPNGYAVRFNRKYNANEDWTGYHADNWVDLIYMVEWLLEHRPRS